MTISRAAWDSIVKFVDGLPDYVPGPTFSRFSLEHRCHVEWDGLRFPNHLYIGQDGSLLQEEGYIESLRERLKDCYRPKPRRFEVLVHAGLGLPSLEAGRGTTVYRDTPENRAYCATEGETWLPFTLVERDD